MSKLFFAGYEDIRDALNLAKYRQVRNNINRGNVSSNQYEAKGGKKEGTTMCNPYQLPGWPLRMVLTTSLIPLLTVFSLAPKGKSLVSEREREDTRWEISRKSTHISW